MCLSNYFSKLSFFSSPDFWLATINRQRNRSRSRNRHRKSLVFVFAGSASSTVITELMHSGKPLCYTPMFLLPKTCVWALFIFDSFHKLLQFFYHQLHRSYWLYILRIAYFYEFAIRIVKKSANATRNFLLVFFLRNNFSNPTCIAGQESD